jgi:hypothetical protein
VSNSVALRSWAARHDDIRALRWRPVERAHTHAAKKTSSTFPSVRVFFCSLLFEIGIERWRSIVELWCARCRKATSSTGRGCSLLLGFHNVSVGEPTPIPPLPPGVTDRSAGRPRFASKGDRREGAGRDHSRAIIAHKRFAAAFTLPPATPIGFAIARPYR